MKVLTWLLTATAATGVFASPAKPPCTTSTAVVIKATKTAKPPASQPTKVVNPTLVNGGFEQSSSSYAPWTVTGPWPLNVASLNPHGGKNVVVVTAPQFAGQHAPFTITQKLDGSKLVAGAQYVLAGWGLQDVAHDATHGCVDIYVGCNGSGKKVTHLPGTGAVNKWTPLKTTCSWTAAQIAKGATFYIRGTDCTTGHYVFDDMTIARA